MVKRLFCMQKAPGSVPATCSSKELKEQMSVNGLLCPTANTKADQPISLQCSYLFGFFLLLPFCKRKITNAASISESEFKTMEGPPPRAE